ncbi:DUF1566 domain-containing protein [Rhodanobacter denitrificans]|nr:DUF1566 domain-containing protein [Rhodanobacter denitrificans]
MSLLQHLTFIKIGSTGEALPIEATEWDAVHVPELGLMYSADNVGGKELDEEEADAACSALTLGGFTDWVQPTHRFELEAILDLSKRGPAIDERLFRNVKNDWYRTKHAIAGSSGLVWVVDFSYGAVYDYHRGSRCWCRAVRRVSPAGQ